MRRSYGKDWEDLARSEPHWAVITDDRFRSTRLTSEGQQAFWQSGESYVRHVKDLFVTHFGRTLAPHRALDFGCGVGRLLLPLARCSTEAVGVDISPTMLEHGRAACDRAGVGNVAFYPGLPTGRTFDFVNSALVLQHIPIRDGLPLLNQLLACLAPGGLLALQVVFARPGGGHLRRTGRWFYANCPPVRLLLNRCRGVAAGAPYMQMNAYPLGRVFALLCAAGLSDLHIILTSERGFTSSLIIGVKSVPATDDVVT